MLPSGGWNECCELKWACVEWVLVFPSYECVSVFVNGFFLCEVLHRRTKTHTEQISTSKTRTYLFLCHGKDFTSARFICWASDHINIFPSCLHWHGIVINTLFSMFIKRFPCRSCRLTVKHSDAIALSYLNMYFKCKLKWFYKQ